MDTDITDFQNKIYGILKKVPKGRVTTYKLLAQRLGSNAYRAVGTAMRKNPFAPIIPCHRVVCSNGEVGNYSGDGGANGKIKLLRDEGVEIDNNKIINFEKVLWR